MQPPKGRIVILARQRSLYSAFIWIAGKLKLAAYRNAVMN